MTAEKDTGTAGRSAALFDIDGTLADTNYLHAVAWHHAFRSHGHTVAMADVHRCIGMGTERLLDEVLPDRDRDRDEDLTGAHRDHYLGYRSVATRFEGARELLIELDRRGMHVVLATSASPPELELLREVLDVDEALAGITSSKDVEHSKPEPEVVQIALQTAGVPPERAVFVGDTVWDVQAAGKAGVACIGLLSGGIGAALLLEAGAVAVYRNVQELAEKLDESPLGHLLAGSAAGQGRLSP